MQLVLASGSPRRKELLEMLGLDFIAVPACGEECPPPGAGPAATVMALACAKAAEIAAQYPTLPVLGADTVVALDNRILGKPRDAADAAAMLRSLSGREHSVFTGLCVMKNGEPFAVSEETRVTFRPLTETEILRYVQSGEPMDKAGAYACQGRAALFIQRMDGDFFNVMGLPLFRLGQLLQEIGVNI